KAELAKLAVTFEKLAEAEGQELIEAVRAKARELPAEIAALLEEIEAAAGQAVETSARGKGRLERTISDNPLTSVFVAALVGFLLGSIGRR
ncbi:MAG: hypothetical protein JOY81_14140, partial [Alphaproteobacteria bacterium]|nr:hypothetical protein [Alphaproteobacteria bacterium]